MIIKRLSAVKWYLPEPEAEKVLAVLLEAQDKGCRLVAQDLLFMRQEVPYGSTSESAVYAIGKHPAGLSIKSISLAC